MKHVLTLFESFYGWVVWPRSRMFDGAPVLPSGRVDREGWYRGAGRAHGRLWGLSALAVPTSAACCLKEVSCDFCRLFRSRFARNLLASVGVGSLEPKIADM